VVTRAWLLVLGACASAELVAPVVRVHRGTARTPARVVAVAASCGALSRVSVPVGVGEPARWEVRSACPAPALRAAELAVRSSLEFAGFHILDAERVNAVTATRRETVRGGVTTSTTAGARFEDATPFEQQEILRALGADGRLAVRISIGAGRGFGARRIATVQLQLLAAPHALVWARRCDVEIGLVRDEVAIEQAARCAVAGATP
jgi:hypothetical protein